MDKLKQLISKFSRLPGIGLRTIKTSLSVLVCLVLYEFLIIKHISYSEPLYACVAAIISMQDTVENSVEYGINRLFGTSIGGAFGIAFLWIDSIIIKGSLKFLLAALGIILVIYSINLLRKKQAISIACVVFLIILVNLNDKNPYLYSFFRVFDTAIGIVISIIINKYINFKKNNSSLTSNE